MKKSRSHRGPRYTEVQATKWLSWLAENMQKHDQSIFLIEGLQASWLPKESERKAHWTLSIIFVGLMFMLAALVIGLVLGLISGWNNGSDQIFFIISWLVLGLIVGWIFSGNKKNNSISTIVKVSWSWGYFKQNRKGQDSLAKLAFDGFLYGLGIGLIFGLFYVVVFGLISLSGLLPTPFLELIITMVGTGLSWGILVMIFALIQGGYKTITAGIKREAPQYTTRPNEGIKLTLRNSGKGLILGPTIVLVPLLICLIKGWEWFGWLPLGLIVGMITALWFGGMSVIRHYTLRFMIYILGYGPWNYADFLDYSVDQLQFLQRVGGGYIFIHQMLLEYFATLEDGKVPVKEERSVASSAETVSG